MANPLESLKKASSIGPTRLDRAGVNNPANWLTGTVPLPEAGTTKPIIEGLRDLWKAKSSIGPAMPKANFDLMNRAVRSPVAGQAIGGMEAYGAPTYLDDMAAYLKEAPEELHNHIIDALSRVFHP